jgi:hypothetical protein
MISRCATTAIMDRRAELMYAPENQPRMDYMSLPDGLWGGAVCARRRLPIHQIYRAPSTVRRRRCWRCITRHRVCARTDAADDSMPNLPAASRHGCLVRLDLIGPDRRAVRSPTAEPSTAVLLLKADLARQLGNWRAVAEISDWPSRWITRMTLGTAGLRRRLCTWVDWTGGGSLALEQNPAVNRWCAIPGAHRPPDLGEMGLCAARVGARGCDDA